MKFIADLTNLIIWSDNILVKLSSLVSNKSINTDGTVSGSWIGENRQKLEKMMKRKYRQSQDVIPGEEWTNLNPLNCEP